MNFKNAEEVDSVCFQMRQGDWPRGKNRALINQLFNGAPPYSDEEAEENGIEVNVNFLESTRLSHDARSQFYQAYLKPGNYFSCTTDSGSDQKRREYSSIVTSEINKVMKRSIPYVECFRSKIAMNVLHGIAPACWRDSHRWRPEAMGVEDVLVPSNTLLTMDNLPFFAIRRSFTAPELIKLTRGSHVDPGWDKALVESCIKWVDEQSANLMSTNWPEAWTPEKVQERIKGDGGFYVGDSVPTIDVFDFYFWSDEGKQAGWRRRMILDSWSNPAAGGSALQAKGDSLFKENRNKFLYNPKDRVFADCREKIINWQFADLSAVAPFRYHSVRSLGFLLYSVCHLQNRMRSKFSEAVFEQMLVYMRVKSVEDAQRALKVDMFNRGFIDETIDFIKAGDRYQVNTGLVELGLRENGNLIAQNSSSYTTQPERGQSNVEKTKFQVMAETQAMTSLVSAGLAQSYLYQVPEYREVFRRFTIKESRDPEVRTFQAACLRRGVPAKILYNPSCWEQEPERVMGAGNKTLELSIAQQLMQYRNLYDPESQREILRDVTLAITDDSDRADALVPMNIAQITDSVHDAQLAMGALMQGLPVAIKSGTNNIEYVDTLLLQMAMLIKQGARSMEQIEGIGNVANHVQQRIQLIAQDPEEKARVKTYGDQLGQLMNALKAQAQQMQEKMQAQGGQANGEDQEAQAKIKAMLMQAEAKNKNQAATHAQKTAQRQIQFEMTQEQKRKDFEMEMEMERVKTMHELQLENARANTEITVAHKKADAAPKPKPSSGK